MRPGAWIAGAIAAATCVVAIAEGAWNQSGPGDDAVRLVLGREGKLVTGGQRNSGQTVRVWLGPDGAVSVPIVRRDWLDSAGFGPPGAIPTLRRAYAVLDAGTEADRGPDGLTVTAVGRDRDALAARYPDRARYLIAPVEIRNWTRPIAGDTVGTLFLAIPPLNVPGAMAVEGAVPVRTGRLGIPYIVR
jgi:hypothetical protein